MHAKGFFGRSIKKLDALLDRSASDPLALAPASRLTRAQQQAIHLNRALLYLLAGKQEQAKELAGLLAKAYPGNSSVTMLQAVLLARSGKVREAREDILKSGRGDGLCMVAVFVWWGMVCFSRAPL